MALRLQPLLDIPADPPVAAGNTYLVTGCAGFIGSHLSEALIERGDRVVGIDSFTDYYARGLKDDNIRELRKRPGFTLLEADLVDAPLPSLVGVVDGVFHLAAQPASAAAGAGRSASTCARTSWPRSACSRPLPTPASGSSSPPRRRSTATRPPTRPASRAPCDPSRRNA
jgi:hypothetical protein